MKTETRNWINTIIGLVALLAAGFFLYRRFQTINLAEVADYLRSLEGMRLLTIVGFWTAISYLVLTGYDWLALRFLKKRISYPRVALASFVGYSISKNLGISWLTGGSMRYRFYSRCGMDAQRCHQTGPIQHNVPFSSVSSFGADIPFSFPPWKEEVVP
ncbi:MAG: LPXTG cell wall anchor domain-containing protein [Candidatus Manganitrophus sp.]|nr:LPXTG cell wall anchor domain-containing protein [Candidatus Manganitrophus sp.]